MPEIVKLFADDEYGEAAAALATLAGDCDNGEVAALAVIVLRDGKPVEMWARVDDGDRARLRAAAIELAGALAGTD